MPENGSDTNRLQLIVEEDTPVRYFNFSKNFVKMLFFFKKTINHDLNTVFKWISFGYFLEMAF